MFCHLLMHRPFLQDPIVKLFLRTKVKKSNPHQPMMANLANLPKEIMTIILGHLSLEERMKCRFLSAKWRQMSFQNIQELTVKSDLWTDESYDLETQIVSMPQYKVCLPDRLSNRRMLKLLLKESGNSFKSLYLCPVFNQTNDDRARWARYWPNLLSKIPTRCPNIVRLFVLFSTDQKINQQYLSLLKHYGHQLEAVSLAGCESWSRKRSVNFCNFLIQHLNPSRLRALGTFAVDQKNFDDIVNKFPLLTRFYLKTSPEFAFSYLPTLVYLKEFFCPSYLDEANFRLFTKTPFAQQFRKLHIQLRPSAQDDPSLFAHFHNFTSLSKLTFSLEGSRFLSLIFDSLPQLTELDLTLCLYESDDQFLPTQLQSFGRLQNLAKLNLLIEFYAPLKFSFRHIPPMRSVTCLDLWFIHYFDDVREVGILFSKAHFLFLAFPNVEHLKFQWEDLPVDHLEETVSQMSHLKCLELRDDRLREEIEQFCEKKQILIVDKLCE